LRWWRSLGDIRKQAKAAKKKPKKKTVHYKRREELNKLKRIEKNILANNKRFNEEIENRKSISFQRSIYCKDGTKGVFLLNRKGN